MVITKLHFFELSGINNRRHLEHLLACFAGALLDDLFVYCERVAQFAVISVKMFMLTIMVNSNFELTSSNVPTQS
jgi:hypothetical protein